MSFFNSVINQIGRDVGRTISNKVLKDAHATPIKIVGQSSNSNERRTNLTSITNQEKLINSIDLSQTPKTIIRKLGAVLIDFDATVNDYLLDGHISFKEEIELAQQFLKILSIFDKIEKQFIINSIDTNELFEVYKEHFEKPVLKCIDKLCNQEDDLKVKEMYENLYHQIKNLVK
jgi:hypothetical protein